MSPEDRAAAKADIANDLKKCYLEAGGALIETVGYGGAPLFMARSKIVALHGATEPGCSTIVVDAAVPNDEWRVREPLSSLVAKVGCGHAAPKIEPDPAEMHPMLQAMQSGEMSVSRGVELLDMWLAGNYSDDQLPPIRHGLGLDELPWDRIDALTEYNKTRTDELMAATQQVAALTAEVARLTETLTLIAAGSTPAKFLAKLAIDKAKS